MRGLSWGAALLLICGCHGARTNRPTVGVCAHSCACQDAAAADRFEAVTLEAEALAGDRAAPSLERRFGGCLCDAKAEERMRRIGRSLQEASPELEGDYCYALLASDELNAFSLPGGRIYITRGLYRLLHDDALLAAVLAHEMAHITAKDSLKPRCADQAEALQREIAADLRGGAYLCSAGYGAAGLSKLVALLADEQPATWPTARHASLAVAYPSGRRSALALLSKKGTRLLLLAGRLLLSYQVRQTAKPLR